MDKKDHSFFNRSGTLQNLAKFADSYHQFQGMKSASSSERLGSLAQLVRTVMSLLG